ncbi:phytase [Nocardioidaceae bacterium SCSIO 66511]|nr:phytase [Nocardioidaceae bacterium SCSIO 66511]
MLKAGTGVVVFAAVVSLTGGGSVSAMPGNHSGAAEIGSVAAEFETRAVFDDEAGGFADTDDPAIWVNPEHRDRSVVIVTQKEAGLVVFDLGGNPLQELPAPPAPGDGDAPGRLNNVDLVYGVPLGDDEEPTDLAVVSDRGRDQVRIYAIDPEAADDGDAPLRDVTADDVPYVFSADQDEVNGEATAYGLAAWQDGDQAYAAVSRNNDTALAQVRLEPTDDGHVTYETVDRLNLPSSFDLPDGTRWTPCGDPGELPQVEGMVVDRDRGVLYAAQENVALWRVPLDEEEFGSVRIVDKVREYGIPWTYDPNADEECAVDYADDPGFGGKHLAADAEGLTIYDAGDGDGQLVASSQGDNTFATYDRAAGNAFTGSFEIVDGDATDGVQECDGADLTSADLGGAFEDGLLVVQDGDNTPDVPGDGGEARDNSNVKFVSWGEIAPGLARRAHLGSHRHSKGHAR